LRIENRKSGKSGFTSGGGVLGGGASFSEGDKSRTAGDVVTTGASFSKSRAGGVYFSGASVASFTSFSKSGVKSRKSITSGDSVGAGVLGGTTDGDGFSGGGVLGGDSFSDGAPV